MSQESASSLNQPLPWLADNRTVPTPQELAHLFRRFCRVLRHPADQHIPKVLRPKGDVEDVLQETCCNAIENLAQFTGSTHAEFFVWFQTILRNTLSNFLRRYKTKARNILQEVAGFGHASSAPVDLATGSWKVMRKEAREALLGAIQDLPEQSRLIVALRCDGKSFDETAASIGLSKIQVYRVYQEAVFRLQERLQPHI
jgi:RNA polymerase sigma factor (sigma-70 family)